MKKKIALLLTLSMMMATACTTGGGNSESTAGGKAANGEAVTQGKEKETLELISVGGSDSQAWMDLVEKTITRFNDENQYHVQMKATWYENEQYKTKFATLMTQNNMADIFSTWEYGFLQPYAEAGKVYDLTEALKKDSQWMDRFDQGALIPTTFNGGVGGMDLFQGIQTGEAAWDDPRYIKSGELLQELAEAGAFPENFSGLAYEEGVPLFTSGKAAMFPMGTWITASILDGMDAENVGVFLPPAYDQANAKTHLSQVSKVFGISETCKNKEAAMAFLKMLSEDDIQEKMVTEIGLLPATKLKVAAAKTDPVTAAIIDLNHGMEPLTPFDVLFGSNIGVEFNNAALAIATGKDPAGQFEQLQAYAESQKE